MVLIGCAHQTYTTDKFLPDGNTWEVTCDITGFNNPCAPINGGISNPKCKTVLDQCVHERGVALCQGDYHKKFACALASGKGWECKVQCKEFAEIKTIRDGDREKEKTKDNQPNPALDRQDKLNKAKKCQSKGGLYIDGRCEIDLN